MPSIWLCGGFDVALMWLWVALPGFSRFQVRGSRFKVQGSVFTISILKKRESAPPINEGAVLVIDFEWILLIHVPWFSRPV
jgi:hypothetical protein